MARMDHGNTFTFEQGVVLFVKGQLDGRWPKTEFKVDLHQDYAKMSKIIRIGFQAPGGYMYLTQEIYEPPYDMSDAMRVACYKLNDETIATIMLLLG